MNSNQLKAEAMAWLRYVCKKPYVCTEVGRWSADVMAVDEKTSVEIEVKISKADLRIEGTSKRTKHLQYKEPDNWYKATIPNRFYFLVPADLKEYAMERAAELNPAYGVLVDTGYGRTGRRLDIIKKAEFLHRRPPPKSMLLAMAKRMSSELATLYVERVNTLSRIEKQLLKDLNDVKQENRLFLVAAGEELDPLAINEVPEVLKPAPETDIVKPGGADA